MQAELDRFCDALISIREEIAQIEKGKADVNNNVLKVNKIVSTSWLQKISFLLNFIFQGYEILQFRSHMILYILFNVPMRPYASNFVLNLWEYVKKN